MTNDSIKGKIVVTPGWHSSVDNSMEIPVFKNAPPAEYLGWYTTDTRTNVGERVVIESTNGMRIEAKRIS